MPDTEVKIIQRCKIYFPALHKILLAADKYTSCNAGTLSVLLAS